MDKTEETRRTEHQFVALVADERDRQREKGYDRAHDHLHGSDGEVVIASAEVVASPPPGGGQMILRPVTRDEAREFIRAHHRHNKPPLQWRISVGVEDDGQLVGVAVAGRPVARALDRPRVLEITRVCTTGERNANSMLYGAIARAARALGYETLYTYTLVSESGASLKAAGWMVDACLPPRTGWDTPSRPRNEEFWPSEGKYRWIKRLAAPSTGEGEERQ